MRRDTVFAAIRVEMAEASPDGYRSLRSLAERLGLHELSDPAGNQTIAGKQATSKLAALEAFPKSGTWRAQVLEAFTDYHRPPAIADHQIYNYVLRKLGAGAHRPSPSTIRARRVELVEGGWLKAIDNRGVTPTGSACIRWGLTQKAKAATHGN